MKDTAASCGELAALPKSIWLNAGSFY